MLHLARNLTQLRFGSLMEIYEEANREHGQMLWPDEPEMRQIQLSEQDFYRYLNEGFFRTPGAVYAVWEAGGQYVSALRLEPYRDGLLMEALETTPEQRRRGYAAALIQAGFAVDDFRAAVCAVAKPERPRFRCGGFMLNNTGHLKPPF